MYQDRGVARQEVRENSASSLQKAVPEAEPQQSFYSVIHPSSKQLNDLPEEVLGRVIFFLDYTTMIAFGRSCKKFWHCIHSVFFAKPVCLAFAPSTHPPASTWHHLVQAAWGGEPFVELLGENEFFSLHLKHHHQINPKVEDWDIPSRGFDEMGRPVLRWYAHQTPFLSTITERKEAVQTGQALLHKAQLSELQSFVLQKNFSLHIKNVAEQEQGSNSVWMREIVLDRGDDEETPEVKFCMWLWQDHKKQWHKVHQEEYTLSQLKPLAVRDFSEG